MNNYKITFHLQRPGRVAFNQEPMFDGLLAYAYHREHAPAEMRDVGHVQKPPAFDFSGLPLVKHPDGYHFASWMFWEEGGIQDMHTFLKKWDEQSDHMADFGKSKRAVHVDRGEFKTTQIPIRSVTTDLVWFYFRSDDVQEVERLIGKHVAGIGKKVSRGYGMFDHFNIQQLPYDPFDGAVIRPIPFKKGDFDGGNVTVQYRAYTFPYWLPENFVPCIVARKP